MKTSRVIAALCLLLCCVSFMQAHQVGMSSPIDEPVVGASYSEPTTIASNGTYTINTQITVKLCKGSSIIDSATVTTDGSGAWHKDWSRPFGGWTAGSDYSVQLWYSGSEVHRHTFTITVP